MTKAPKIAATPICWATKAESRTPTKITPSQIAGTRPTSSKAVASRPRKRRPIVSIAATKTPVQPDDHERVDPRARAGDGGREREQAPRRDVVDRGAGHRERADRPLQHALLDEDAREHRERRDRHRDAHEEGERQVVDVRREDAVDRDRGEEAEREREGDARVRDERRLADPVPDQLRVELHPDEEEVERQSDLGGGADQRDDVRREEVVLDLGRDRAEQRRPEQDPGEHLAHHLRLAEPPEQEPHQRAPRGSRPRSPASAGRTSPRPSASPAASDDAPGSGSSETQRGRDLLVADRARRGGRSRPRP